MNDPSSLNDPRGTAIADPLGLGLIANGVAPAPPVDDGAVDAQTALPADHPAWQRDTVAVSARVRQVLATLRPAVVRIVTFWDHVVHSARLGDGRTVRIDVSGCYRLG